jgi:ClpP class serine protease
MSGERARKGGLVDQRGGLETAIAEARKKAGLPEDAAIELWPKKRSFLERIATAVGGGGDAKALAARGMAEALPKALTTGLVSMLVRGDTGTFAAMPYSLTIR